MHIKSRPLWACPQNIKENLTSAFMSSDSSGLLWICVLTSSQRFFLFFLLSLHQRFMSAAVITVRTTWLQLLRANKVIIYPLKKKELEPTETSLSLKQKNKLGRRWHNDLLVLQQCNYKHDEGLVNLNDQLQYFIWSRHRVAGEIEGNVWSFSPDFYSKCDAVPAGNVGNVLICVFQEKELQDLAAMDMELQKIAAKLHENTA